MSDWLIHFLPVSQAQATVGHNRMIKLLAQCHVISSEGTVNSSDSQSDCPVGEQAGIRRFSQLLLAAADPSAQSLDAVRLGPLVRAAAAAGGGEQPGTSPGEPRLGGGQ